MTDVAVLADDTTGALEVGALLAGEGIQTEVCLHAGEIGRSRATVLDTDTRHATQAEAFESLLRTIRSFPTSASLFKKTDSTLRGNIGAEIAAVCRARPEHLVVYAAAYPSAGRTVIDGVLYVNGVPVAQTDFAADPRSPVRTSSIAELLETGGIPCTVTASDTVSLRSALEHPSAGVIVCDGGEDADLVNVAHAVRGRRDVILAGPGGIARFWARLLDFKRTEVRAMPTVRRWLVVCGSMHPTSRRQLAMARRIGIPCVASPEERCAGAAIGEVVRAATRAARNGETDGWIVFGGETARAVLLESGCRRLTPLAEVLPGVPISLAHADGFDIPVVTKAGGFGDENLVECILERLSR